jgi:alpha-mannosidase
LYSKDIGGSLKVLRDAIKQEFEFNCCDFGGGSFCFMITVYNDMPRIDIKGHIENKSKDVRYLSASALNFKEGKITRGVPFGHAETKEGEYPAVDFMDYSGSSAGLTVLNAGIPGNAVKDGVMSICLMRAVTYKTYSGGGYDESESASGGFEIGKSIPFKFSLLPHKNKCDPAAAAKAGRELNVCARVAKCEAHSGKLPAKHSFLSVNSPNIIASCFKYTANGYILRIYEAGGQNIENAEISVNLPEMSVLSAAELDFTEKELFIQNAKIKDNRICFPLGANEIKSFKIKFK